MPISPTRGAILQHGRKCALTVSMEAGETLTPISETDANQGGPYSWEACFEDPNTGLDTVQ
jgi:hypothetical protein